MLRLRLTYFLITWIACCSLFTATAQGQINVRMETNLGNIDIELYDDATPVTVENFLRYINSGLYNGTFIHRSMPGFVIQGGGYYENNGSYTHIPVYSPIVNEYDASRSNIRGTIAMAKLGGNPNSATSEWFFNLADNSANLDVQNGGFTTFGRVIGNGMDIVDAIAALDTWDASNPYGGTFTNLPLIGFTGGSSIDPLQHLVLVNRVRTILVTSGNQATMENANGNIVALTAVVPATLSNVAVSDNPHASNTPNDVTFQEGFFSFQVDGLTPGGSTMVAMQLPSGYVPDTYYMYGPTPDNHNPHWYKFEFDGETGAEFFGNNYVVLNFVDGERGDADLTANGQISDPGAPGISTATTPTPSSSGGGCTLSANPKRASIPADYWLFALAFVARYWYRTRTGAAWQPAKMS